MVYLQAVLDLPALEPDELDLLPLFCACLTEVGSAGRDYRTTQARQAAVTGGINARANVRGGVDDVTQVKGVLVLAGKALARNHAELSDLLWETLTAARFDELPRCGNWSRRCAPSARKRSPTTAHAGAGRRQRRAESGGGAEPSLGWPARLARPQSAGRYPGRCRRAGAFAERLERLRDRLRAPAEATAGGQRSRAAGRHRRGAGRPLAEGGSGDDPAVRARGPGPAAAATGFRINTQVNFCAKAYPTVASNHPDAAALQVLGDFLRNGYLHRAIREQGGAYGGGAGYHPDSGAFRFYSYRDPRLADTLADFDRALDWLQTHDHPPRTLEEAILGIIAAIDKPGSPAGEAVSAFFGTLFGRTPEQRRAFPAARAGGHLGRSEAGRDDLSPPGAGPLRGARQRADSVGTGGLDYRCGLRVHKPSPPTPLPHGERGSFRTGSEKLFKPLSPRATMCFRPL
jgi:hypothetical protein